MGYILGSRSLEERNFFYELCKGKDKKKTIEGLKKHSVFSSQRQLYFMPAFE